MQINGQPMSNYQASQPPETGRALVPYKSATEVVALGKMEEAPAPNTLFSKLLSGAVDVRSISPRKMTELSLDLYALGVISFDDYSALAYHAELHPDYNRTIGALTGEPAEPERKRNLITEWEDKHSFLNRHSSGNTRLIEQSGRITAILRVLAQPTDVDV